MSNDGSEEIEKITVLLSELKTNYYHVMDMLDELDDSDVNVLEEDYKRVIDAIKGVHEYL